MKTFMAFDYGNRWTGVAVGSRLSYAPASLQPIRVKKHKIDQNMLEEAMKTWEPDAFIIGMAYHADGTLSPIGKKAQEFAAYLERKYHKPCYYVDERLSSWQAAIYLNAQKQQKHASIHSQSAAIILETFLAHIKDQPEDQMDCHIQNPN